jgi:hypothetical protein
MGFAFYRAQTDRSRVRNQKGAAMPTFTVTSIIDGDTFEVNPLWKWNGETGTRGRLVCEVYFRNTNLADYFPEWQ